MRSAQDLGSSRPWVRISTSSLMTGLSLTVHTLEGAVMTTLESCYKHWVGSKVLALLLLDLSNKCQHYSIDGPAAFADSNYKKLPTMQANACSCFRLLVCLPLLGKCLWHPEKGSSAVHPGHTQPFLLCSTRPGYDDRTTVLVCCPWPLQAVSSARSGTVSVACHYIPSSITLPGTQEALDKCFLNKWNKTEFTEHFT